MQGWARAVTTMDLLKHIRSSEPRQSLPLRNAQRAQLFPPTAASTIAPTRPPPLHCPAGLPAIVAMRERMRRSEVGRQILADRPMITVSGSREC